MSTAAAAADVKPDKPPKAKGGGAGKALFMIVAFVAGAAAGGFGAVLGVSKLGGLGGEHASPAAEPAAAPSAVEYVEVDQAFTSNLADTGRYLQIRLSVSTSGGPEMTAAITKHKPALVSAILSVLGEMSEADVADHIAKDRLRARLKDVINTTLKANGVTGGIDAVFFTSLVVQ